MKTHIDKFLNYLEIEKGASSHTLRAYREDLHIFLEYIESGVKDITLNDIRGFVAEQINKGNKKTTVGRRLATVRSFMRFLHREGYIKANPAKLVTTPKLPKVLPKFLSIDDTFSLVEKPEGKGFGHARNRAILELLYSSGLRVSELSGLNIEDINLREGLIKVRGKGKKERIVPAGKKAIEAINAYLTERVLLKKKDDVLFLNKNCTRLTDRSIRRIVVKYAKAIGIDGSIGPHTLRHTFASHLIQDGADLRVIQELLGHSSLSTTQKYTHLDITHLMDTYDKAHPLAKDGKK
jgi:integrase/recombinase XerC